MYGTKIAKKNEVLVIPKTERFEKIDLAVIISSVSLVMVDNGCNKSNTRIIYHKLRSKNLFFSNVNAAAIFWLIS